jgi:tetratricopeptide (TPR) repeat protein
VPEGVDAFHDAMAGLGRVREAQGRLQDAIALYERAVAIGPDPGMLSALGDLYVELGQPEKAQPLFDQLLRTTKDTSEDRRSLALFLVEHDRDLPRALELAQRDFAERPDIYGRDLLAWALFKNGRFDEADSTIAQALKVGTKDARVLYHTGMISMKRGNKAQARAYLEQALSVNPHFDRRGAKEARAALLSLGQ